MAGMLVHEWLSRTGGSENVFEQFGAIFPDAERFCLWNESDGRFSGVQETFLARTPLRGRKAAALPLMPLAWRMLPDRDVDWVLCSSHAFSHHARFGGVARDAPKLVYAHTPARYVWVPELDGRGGNVVARVASGLLRPLDRRRAQEPTAIAANSRYIADRVLASWGRSSTVIYPPVDVEYFSGPPETLSAEEQSTLAALPDDFLFGVSRLIPYKRMDLVIVAGAASGIPVVIGGEGPEEESLRALAAHSNASVTFVGRPSRAMLGALYRRARAVVFAPIEDFGIIPVEAMASGTPVIVNAVGGAAESVIDGVTGVVLTEWTDAALRTALESVSEMSPDACVARATTFSAAAFEEHIHAWMTPHVGAAA